MGEGLQPGQDLERRMFMKNNIKTRNLPLFLLLFFGLIFTSCGGVDTEQQNPLAETSLPENMQIEGNSIYWIWIKSVQVREKDSIEFSGSTNIPEGNCLFTELYENNALSSWWPVGKCFPSTGGDWQFSIALGKEGVPEQLDTNAAYVFQAYWPGDPENVRASFPFDLTPPPSE